MKVKYYICKHCGNIVEKVLENPQVITKLCSNERKSSLLLFLFSGTRGNRTEITTEFDGIMHISIGV